VRHDAAVRLTGRHREAPLRVPHERAEDHRVRIIATLRARSDGPCGGRARPVRRGTARQEIKIINNIWRRFAIAVITALP
jgi:hypothetical protein